MTRVMMYREAGPNERFAAGAFDRTIGKTVPLTGDDGESLGAGVVVAADVSADGQRVEFTFELNASVSIEMLDGPGIGQYSGIGRVDIESPDA